MYREIIFPSEQKPVYEFPKESYGKKVEIIIDDVVVKEEKSTKEILKEFTFNSGGFKFNRDEANNYE